MHVRDRLQHWSLRLLGLQYQIDHISGERNLWADIVSRWQPRSSLRVSAVHTRRQTPTAVADLSRLRPLSDAIFVSPSHSDIVEAQKVAASAAGSLPVVEEEGMLVVDHKPWIPTGAEDLLARIMVLAHCGAQGHRGEAAMESLLGERFIIVQLHKKVFQFIKSCLICKHVKGSRHTQRPYGSTFTATVRNDALRWDFMRLIPAHQLRRTHHLEDGLGEGRTSVHVDISVRVEPASRHFQTAEVSMGDVQCVLVLKNSLTHFCELVPCSTLTAYVTADGLVD
ncbi:unnamed protein product [Phytophthora fragariaefolia]|uniref:Unnamed protein product n=1 Tax=Phytophthora fragariaefolia TaxID=1490495 RepID=A0A9W6YNA4_9STRA|nr:unnamed protein product [Phytophthora fragariaefolia]